MTLSLKALRESFLYSPIVNSKVSLGDDEAEHQPFVGEHVDSGRLEARNRARLLSWLIILNIISIVTFLFLSLRLLLSGYSELNPEYRKSHFYSPAYDWLDLGFQTVSVNGSLFPEDEKPRPRRIARQMPNEEADKVWDEWGVARFFPLTAEQMHRLGKDTETAVHLENKHWGLGDDAYAATFDVNHQLHCIDTLRRFAYAPYYNATPLDASQEGFKEIHANHCIDSLVQTVQCSGNLNFITMHWYEDDNIPVPMPDMSIKKQCINWDHYMDWRKQNSISNDRYDDIFGHKETQPKDLKTRRAMETEYVKIHGNTPKTGPYMPGHGH